jgi:hypothetical protein
LCVDLLRCACARVRETDVTGFHKPNRLGECQIQIHIQNLCLAFLQTVRFVKSQIGKFDVSAIIYDFLVLQKRQILAINVHTYCVHWPYEFRKN